MTSNIGVKKLQEFGGGVGYTTTKNVFSDQEKKTQLLKKELKQFFAPEFLNRVDDVIVFNTLSKDDIKKIVDIELSKLLNRLTTMDYNILFDESVNEHISKIGYDEMYGARPMKRAIQDTLEDFISEEILKGTLSQEHKYLLKIVDEQPAITKRRGK